MLVSKLFFAGLVGLFASVSSAQEVRVEKGRLKNMVMLDNELDKTILTCSKESQPTFCEAPDANIDCVTLTDRMNECTNMSLVNDEFVVYDPNNCGDGLTDPINGCGGGVDDYCRQCGYDDFFPCAYGFYEPYYEPNANQTTEEANQRTGEQTISDMLGVPVRVNCDKYYEILESYREGPFNDGIEDMGRCELGSTSFKIPPLFVQQRDSVRFPIQACPPQLIGDFTAYGNNARYQLKTTTNSFGDTFPRPGADPDLAVSNVPAQIPITEYDEKCDSLALGQEINIFDAGEISSFALTAKTMAERQLRPAVFGFTAGIVNCCNIVGTNSDCTPCDDYSAVTIDNPLTWANNSGNERIPYEYPIPNAANPHTSSTTSQRTRRVAKGMHGKGQSCIYAKFSLAPLMELYNENLGEGDSRYIPKNMRVGLLDMRLAKTNVEFDAMVRLAGNKNITDLKDVHDIRIRGFAIKLFGVKTAFRKYGLNYKQIWLPYIPAYDQPTNAQYTFGDYTFSPEEEEGNVDLLHVAIGNGNVLGTNESLNDIAFDPTTEEGSRNPPDNVFVAHNVDNYYNGFILGGNPDIATDTITDVYQNPLSYTYGSASALRAGPGHSIKLHWAACPGEQDKIQNVYSDLEEAFKDANFFYTNLKETLEKLEELGEDELKFCGYIQIQQDPCTEPLDDPTERWLTESIKVFELTFPAQYVPDYDTFCDNTVYNPWRTIQEHQPQGFVNRVRMAVYSYAAFFRLIINNGVQKTKNGNTIQDTLNQNTCPYGFTSDSIEERFQPVPVGERPNYQGLPVLSLSQLFDYDASTGEIPDPEPSSSAGICITDDQCQLPFGPDSVCKNNGKCKPTNDGLWGND